jgi:hypothetical protein
MTALKKSYEYLQLRHRPTLTTFFTMSKYVLYKITFKTVERKAERPLNNNKGKNENTYMKKHL